MQMLKELPLSLSASLNSRPFNGLWLLYFTSCLQCCDLGYHASLARTLRTYLSAEYSLETSRHEGLDLLEGAVDAMDIRGDKLKFMDTHSQIFCPPACFDYQPHMGDEVSHHRIRLQGCLVVLGTKCISPCSLFLSVKFSLFLNPRCVRWVHSSLSRQSSWCATTSCSLAWPHWRLKMKRWECAQVSAFHLKMKQAHCKCAIHGNVLFCLITRWHTVWINIHTEPHKDTNLVVVGSLQHLWTFLWITIHIQ